MDKTESIRRTLVDEQRAAGPQDREALVAKHGEVLDTVELQERYTVRGFMAPFVVVTRKADGVVGSLEFQHMPRFYFNFTPDKG